LSADGGKLPYDLLEKISLRITNEVRGLNRVVFDLTRKPPGTIAWDIRAFRFAIDPPDPSADNPDRL